MSTTNSTIGTTISIRLTSLVDQTPTTAEPGSPDMPWGTATVAFVEALNAQLRLEFASELATFECGGHCQARIIGVTGYEGAHWAPGLLFNYRLPPIPMTGEGPHYFRQWAFRMDLPGVTTVDLLAPAMVTVLPRLPGIRQVLMSMHQTLGYIDSWDKEDAFESHTRGQFYALDDDTGMQLLLCPVNDATQMHSRLVQFDPLADGFIEDWLLDWCDLAAQFKSGGEPALTTEFLASLRRADSDGNWFSAHGRQMRLIAPRLEERSEGLALILEMPVKHNLPLFELENRYQLRGCTWSGMGCKVVDAGMLGMDPGYFMTAVNLGCNPLALGRLDGVEKRELASVDFNM